MNKKNVYNLLNFNMPFIIENYDLCPLTLGNDIISINELIPVLDIIGGCDVQYVITLEMKIKECQF